MDVSAWKEALVQGLGLEDIRAVVVSASQMVSDMEEGEAIPDVAMLCRFVLVREELYATMEDIQPGSTRDQRYSSLGVPRAAAALVNAMTQCDDPIRRQMQLYRWIPVNLSYFFVFWGYFDPILICFDNINK